LTPIAVFIHYAGVQPFLVGSKPPGKYSPVVRYRYVHTEGPIRLARESELKLCQNVPEVSLRSFGVDGSNCFR